MHATFPHDSVKQADVQGNDRDRGRGLGNHGLVHRHLGPTADSGPQLAVDCLRGPLQMLLRPADGSAPVNGPGEDGTDIREWNDPCAFGQQPGFQQRFAPPAQVVAAHDAHRAANAFVRRRFHGDLVDDLAVQVDGLTHVGLPDGVENGLINLAGIRIRALRRGQAVYDDVYLAEPGRDELQGLPFYLVRVRIAVDVGRDQSVLRRVPVVCRGVIESRRTALCAVAFPFEENAHRTGAVHGARRDPRRQSVSGRRADNQHAERSGAVLSGGLGDLDLSIDVRSASRGMRRGTDEPADARFDDGLGHVNGSFLV